MVVMCARRPLNKHLVVRGVIGGLGLGISGALLPLTLFSGRAETGVMIHQSREIGAIGLVLLALVKMLVTALCLATGWKGGYIFPRCLLARRSVRHPTFSFP